MHDMNKISDTPPTSATPLSESDEARFTRELLDGATATAVKPYDFDAIGLKMAREQRASTRRSSVESFFGAKVVRTDWDHPNLQPNKAAIEKCLAWKFNGRGLCLYGPQSGGGKTRTMAALIMRLHAVEAIGCSMWHAQELFSEITQRQEYGRDCAGELINALAGSPLLLVEDFGQECTSRANADFAVQWFFRLLDIRYSRGLPLMMTTNRTSRTMFNAAHDDTHGAALRRLLETAEPVFFKGITGGKASS